MKYGVYLKYCLWSLLFQIQNVSGPKKRHRNKREWKNGLMVYQPHLMKICVWMPARFSWFISQDNTKRRGREIYSPHHICN